VSFLKLERYGHGGDLRTAEESYGIAADEWLDFSSNMNPWGPPAVVGDIMRDRWREIVRYPDPGVRSLRSKLSQIYRVPAESILVGNGAAELIDLVIRVTKPVETILARPSFSEYEEAVHKTGGAVSEILLSRENGFLLPDSIRQWIERAEGQGSTFFLGHPNNPTGRLIPSEILRDLTDSDAPLIVDEAFMDFVPDESRHSLIRVAAESRRVIVIRSMTKFYAVPGIRLGFVVAHPDTVRQLSALQTQWSVNFLAQLIGEAVLGEHAYAKRTRDWLMEERPWLTGQLQELGLSVVPSDVNFLLVRLSADHGMNVTQLQQEMARRGIMIRDASLFAGLDTSYFRVAIRLRHENERLVQLLQEVIKP
jgi:threonine-phosphate decarboxylase